MKVAGKCKKNCENERLVIRCERKNGIFDDDRLKLQC